MGRNLELKGSIKPPYQISPLCGGNSNPAYTYAHTLPPQGFKLEVKSLFAVIPHPTLPTALLLVKRGIMERE